MPDTKEDWRGLGGLAPPHEREMPDLRQTHQRDPVVALCCSDVHMSHARPACRADKDWYAVQAFYLKQLGAIKVALAGDIGLAQIPILCAGDILHTWDSPPELINFLVSNIPFMYTIPGQHDIPHHEYNLMHMSAYQTLVKTRMIIELYARDTTVAMEGVRVSTIDHASLTVHPFPWGVSLAHPRQRHPSDKTVDLLMAHKYVWIKGCEIPGSDDRARIKNIKKLKNYTAAIFGDNHTGFLTKTFGVPVLNCGTFIRRRLGEIEYKPSVGLLHKSGRFTRYYLDTSIDKFADPEKKLNKYFKSDRGANLLVDKIRTMGVAAWDFVSFVRDYLSTAHINPRIKKTIRGILKEVESERQGKGVRAVAGAIKQAQKRR